MFIWRASPGVTGMVAVTSPPRPVARLQKGSRPVAPAMSTVIEVTPAGTTYSRDFFASVRLVRANAPEAAAPGANVASTTAPSRAVTVVEERRE